MHSVFLYFYKIQPLIPQVMKSILRKCRITAAILSAILCTPFIPSSCSHGEKISTEPGTLPEMLTLKILNISDTSVSVRCESNSPGTPYYLRICPYGLAEGLDDKELTERDLKYFEEECSALELTLEEYLDIRLDNNSRTTTLNSLEADSPYCAYAYGIDYEGNVTSKVTRAIFRTLSGSENPIAIEINETGTDKATISFSPKDPEMTYIHLLLPGKEYLDLDERECLDKLMQTDFTERDITKGNTVRTFTGLQPDTEYMAFAFGYDTDNSLATTALSRKSFSTGRLLTDLTVDISIDDITAENAKVTFIPSDNSQEYFFNIQMEDKYKGLSDNEIIEKAIKEAEGYFFNSYLISGQFTDTPRLVHDTDYIAYAFGYDRATNNVTTGLFKKVFRSGHLDVSELSFSISVTDLTPDTGTVTFTPTNDIDRYFYYVTESSDFKGLSSDDEIIEKALSLPVYASIYICNGGKTVHKAELNPATEYTAIAFGYSTSGVATTRPYMQTFETEAWDDPAQLFKITSETTSTTAKFRIIPADKKMKYFSDIISAEDAAGLDNDALVKKLINEAWNIDLYIRYGIKDDGPFTGLKPDTEYLYVIFGYDKKSASATTEATIHRFRTLKE